MKFYHVTPASNFFPIGVLGILQQYAQTRRGGIYLVTESQIGWAVKHTRVRHRSRRVAVFEVNIPRRWLLNGKLTKGFKRGVWVAHVDILPCRIENGSYHD